MAGITFTVASTAINGTKTFTLTDAEITRAIAAYKPRVGAAATNNQVLLFMAQEVMDRIKATTLDFERVSLAAGATPLNPT